MSKLSFEQARLECHHVGAAHAQGDALQVDVCDAAYCRAWWQAGALLRGIA